MYRYTLERKCAVPWATKRILWVMHNPSAAKTVAQSNKDNDPTVRKLIGFTTRWGFASLSAVNMYAYCATKPKEMWAARASGIDIVGPDNDETILAADRAADMVVVAWGKLPSHALARRDEVLRLLDHRRELYALARNGDGSPQHPLMAPYAAPIVYRHATWESTPAERRAGKLLADAINGGFASLEDFT